MTAAAPHMTRIEAADRLARIAADLASLDDVTACQVAARHLLRRHFQNCRWKVRRKTAGEAAELAAVPAAVFHTPPQELDALRDAAQGLAPDDATPEAVVAAPPLRGGLPMTPQLRQLLSAYMQGLNRAITLVRVVRESPYISDNAKALAESAMAQIQTTIDAIRPTPKPFHEPPLHPPSEEAPR